MHPEALSIADFDYELPPDRIALHPLPERDASRLLVWDGHGFTDSEYRDIANRLTPGTCMVFNDTRVTDARLLFPVSDTQSVEVFLLEPADGGSMLAESLGQGSPATCRCLIGGIAGGVTCAALIGVAIPNVLRWLEREPQVAAGPVSLAATDMVTLMIYFTLARFLLA